MRAVITFEIGYDIEVPDDFCDRVRALQAQFGESYLRATSSDQEILERIALIRGVRGLQNDEALDDELNDLIEIIDNDEEVIDFTLIG